MNAADYEILGEEIKRGERERFITSYAYLLLHIKRLYF